MAMLSLELQPQETQRAFNLSRWAELLEDPELARFEGRIETDRHGHIIMSPPAAATHGSFQAEIAYLLRTLLPKGRVLTECPVSTADGVKITDVAWASPACLRELAGGVCFPRAPEICVEVISPSNTEGEIREKTALYFDAGASEVWLCAQDGQMSFLGRAAGAPLRASKLCPRFPNLIQLR